MNKKSIAHIIAKLEGQELSEKYKEPGWGCYSRYYKINKYVGCKALMVTYHKEPTSCASLLKSSLWKMAMREFKLLRRAYPSGITPEPYAVIPVKVLNQWCPGILMEHIRGEYPKFDVDDDGNPCGKSKKLCEKLYNKILSMGLRHIDLHEFNIIQSGPRTYKVIDFTPDFVKRIRLTKKKG